MVGGTKKGEAPRHAQTVATASPKRKGRHSIRRVPIHHRTTTSCFHFDPKWQRPPLPMQHHYAKEPTSCVSEGQPTTLPSHIGLQNPAQRVHSCTHKMCRVSGSMARLCWSEGCVGPWNWRGNRWRKQGLCANGVPV